MKIDLCCYTVLLFPIRLSLVSEKTVKLIFCFIPSLFFVSDLILWSLVRVVFQSAKAFNSDVSEWDVARVENMEYSM